MNVRPLVAVLKYMLPICVTNLIEIKNMPFTLHLANNGKQLEQF